MIDFSFWFMFPVAILIATIAMMFGVGGAVFFSPLFFLVLRLQPEIALAAGIFIEFFGFSSGFIGYAKNKMIDYSLGKKILLFSIPATIIGVFIGKYVSSQVLIIIFGAGMLILAASLFNKNRRILPKNCKFYEPCEGMKNNISCYVLTNKKTIYSLSSIGGFFLGMVSSGLGEINEYSFLTKLKMHTARASGTSVFIVMSTAFVASITNITYFITNFDNNIILKVASLLIFTVPGVIIGAQLGVLTAKKISESTAKKVLSFIFLIIGLLSLIKLF